MITFGWHAFWRAKRLKAERDIYKSLSEYKHPSSVLGQWDAPSLTYIIQESPSGPIVDIIPRNTKDTYEIIQNPDEEPRLQWISSDGNITRKYKGNVSVGGNSVIIEYTVFCHALITSTVGTTEGVSWSEYRIDAALKDDNTLEGTIVEHANMASTMASPEPIVTNRFLAGRKRKYTVPGHEQP